MDYKPRPILSRSLNTTYKKKRIFWFNSDFNDAFTSNNNKITDITFNIPPFQLYNNNNMRVISYTRNDANVSPIIIKLKEPYCDNRLITNTDKEGNAVIYVNHTGHEGMTSMSPNFLLIPQQIPRFVFRLDDNFNQLDSDFYFSSVTNGSFFQVAGGSPNDKNLLFNSSGSFILNQPISCDILLVGGGGGGGYDISGGGGSGAILLATNYTLPIGSYSITVGTGGTGSSSSGTAGGSGGNSSITISGNTYTATGGGGGGSRVGFTSGSSGANGGSGGGGSHSDSTANNDGGISTKNTYSGWLSYGNAGGFGKDGYQSGYGSGGGGGAGSAGGNASGNVAGNGGTGISLSSYFGTSVGHEGWFGGGGGGNSHFGTNGFGNGGNGLLGGGGNGLAGNGLANTGGGGGGAGFSTKGGNGGSGIVIIKFKKTRQEGITPVNNKPPSFILGLELEDIDMKKDNIVSIYR